MIWFACKQCGKRHGRGDHLAGTLVFCECGTGNRVPWSSTASEPEAPAAPPPPPRPQPPRPSWAPAPLPPSRALRPLQAAQDEDDSPPPPPPPPPRKPREVRRVRPQFCLQHDESASTVGCDDCKMRFCDLCVVTLQEHTLCGPCKNFRLRARTRPPRTAPLAVVALVVALVSGPMTLMMTLLAVSRHLEAAPPALSVVLCMVGTVLPTVAAFLGWLALRQIETRAQMGGRGLAASGSVLGLAGALWGLSVAAVVLARQVQG